MYSYNIDVDILVNDRPVKKLAHQSKTFIESKHWTEYSIRLRNNDAARRLVVVSVDGINVIDGQAAGSTKAGYVLNGYNSFDIKGFRTSNDVVHPFKFNRKGRSYAAKSEVTQGDVRNCGVIGVEVYCEKVTPQPQIVIKEVIREVEKPVWYPWNHWYGPYRDYTFTSNTNGNLVGQSMTFNCNLSNLQTERSLDTTNLVRSMNCNLSNAGVESLGSEEPIACACSDMDMAAAEPKRGFDMGTEFSEREVSSKVHDVEFEIGYLLGTVSIYYASRESLLEMGVPLAAQAQVAFPNPFPTRFCQPPR